MDLKVLWIGRDRNGCPLRDLFKMINYSHPKVNLVEYTGTELGDVILGTNCIDNFPKNIRKIMYMGSLPCFRKGQSNKKGVKYDKVDHMFFISEYFRRIILSKWDIKDSSVFLPFGSMPCDPNMEPIIETRKITGPLQFVAMAKWYKRKYKRLNKVVEFFNNFILKNILMLILILLEI